MPTHPQSDGARPLYGAQYFARLTQRLISALTSQTNYGALYHVDMRLRPSGRSGPVATSSTASRATRRREAWTWEHMALTRARVVSGSPAFAARVEAVIRAVLCRDARRRPIAGDVVEMRAAIAKEKGDERPLGPQICRGRAGRSRVHRAISATRSRGRRCRTSSTPRPRACSTRRCSRACCRRQDADVLRPAARLYQNLTQILRLCLPRRVSIRKTAGPGLLGLLARAADCRISPTLDAHAAVETQARRCARCFNAHARARAARRLAANFVGALAGRCCSGRRAQRQADHDQRAGAGRGADAHRAAMQLDQRFRDGKAKPRALMALGELALDLLERPAEFLAARRAVDADAGIRDRDDDGAARHRAPRTDDAAAVGRELHGVGQEIEHDLLQRAAVGAQAQRRGAISAVNVQLLVLRRAPDTTRMASARIWSSSNVFEIEPDAAGLDLRHVENVVDDVEQIVAAVAGCRGSIRGICRRRARRTCPTSMISEKPMMALSGVRSSWLMLARNSDFAWLASSARVFSSAYFSARSASCRSGLQRLRECAGR